MAGNRKAGGLIHPDDIQKAERDKDVLSPSDAVSFEWWNDENKEKAYLSVITVVNTIEKGNHGNDSQNRLYEVMYGDNRGGVGKVSSLNRWQGAAMKMAPRLSINVVQSCIDTLASKIASNKPKPMFIPNEGDWKLQSKAKMATDFIEGVWDAAQAYPKAQRSFTDALIYGISGLYINSKFDKINVEYIMRDEIFVDELDGHDEKPRQLYLKRFMSRAKLIKQYPKHKEKLKKIPPVKTDAHMLINNSISDMIVCIEAWHLPTSEDSDDGKYCLSVENETLELSEWNHMEFPVIFFRPYHKPHSFWGRGLAETLFTIQMSLNRSLRTIQSSQDQVSTPKVLIENGSQIDTDSINDRIGQLIFYTGTPPNWVSPTAMNPEIYQWIQYLEQHAYQISGISQSSAAGEKPKDVESAVAMETVADIEAGRFENMSISWNNWFMDLARMTMIVAKDLYSSNKKLTVKLKKDNLVRLIDWSQMDFTDDKFSIQLFPINRLPHDPAGRLDMIERYTQAGFIDQIHAMKLMEMPDISEDVSLITSSLNLVSQMIATMLDEGKPVSPIEQMDLALARNECKLAIVKATTQKYPEEHIQLVIDFDQKCKDMLDFMAMQQQKDAMQNQASAQSAPLARPEKTPRSPLLPNAPQPSPVQ